MWKRFLGAAVALTLVGGLVGCGSTSQSQTKTETPTVPAAPAPTVEISFWHGMSTESAQGKTLNEIVDKFNAAQKKYHVTGTYQGSYGDLNTKLLAAVSASNGPIMTQMTDDMQAKLVAAQTVVPLDAFVATLKAEDKKDMNPTLLDHGKVGDKYFGWPFNKSTVILIYDKKLVPTAPKTLDDFVKAAKAATKGDQVFGTAFPPTVDTFSQFFLINGGKWLSADGKTAAFNSPEGVQALQTIVDLVKAGSGYSMPPKTYQSNIFNEGKAAMVATTSASLSFVAEGSNGKRDWAVAPMFTGKTDKVDASGTQLGILTTAKPDEQKGAWEFMQFLTNAENIANWAIKTGYMPLRESARQTQIWKDAVAKDPTIDIAATELSRIEFQPATASWFDVRNEITNAVSAAIGGKDPKTVLDAAAQKANSLMAKQ